MTIKVLCDVPGCGREIDKNYNHLEVKVGQGEIGLRMGGSSPGDVCKYCVIDAFKKLDDRRLEAPRPWPSRVDGVTVSKRPVILHVDVARYGHEQSRLEVFGQTKPGVRMTREAPSELHALAVYIANFARKEQVDYITVASHGCGNAVIEYLKTMDVPPLLIS